MARPRRAPRPPLPRFAVAWFPAFRGLERIGAFRREHDPVAPPIPVSFRAVRMHANEFVFLMASRGASSIVGLHDRLYTRSLAAHLRPEFAYEPHITIARHSEWPKLEAAFDAARESFGDELTDVIRDVDLLAVGRTGKIARLSTFALHAS